MQLNPKHYSLWFLLFPLIPQTVDEGESDGLTLVQNTPASMPGFNDAHNHAKFNVLWGDTYGPRKFEEAH